MLIADVRWEYGEWVISSELKNKFSFSQSVDEQFEEFYWVYERDIRGVPQGSTELPSLFNYFRWHSKLIIIGYVSVQSDLELWQNTIFECTGDTYKYNLVKKLKIHLCMALENGPR